MAITGLLPADQIIAHSRDIVSDALGAKALAGHLRQVKAITRDTAREYAGRFLIELVQNGYDALPKRSQDGRLAILLDAHEPPNGALYVANTGRPFTMADVVSISELAQSTKPPGEGIGHKGLGFKSVLEVTEWPEIYSGGSAGSGTFEGFVFGFARPADITGLAPDAADLPRVLADISPYALPMPIHDQPATVGKFADAGFVTVVRLPFYGPEALRVAAAALGALREESVPVQLFLERLATIEIRDTSNSPELMTLTRAAHAVASKRPDVRLEHVDLSTQGTYLVASRPVEPAAMLAAIDESVAGHRVDETWLEWKEEARVSVAVRLGEREAGRLYTFLPMGAEVSAPLAAHVNAPFVTRVARDHLDRNIPLNRVLLDVAAQVCAAAAASLASQRLVWARPLIVDLIAWTPDEITRLRGGFAALGMDLGSAPVLPVVQNGTRRDWAAPDSSWRWEDKDKTLLTTEVMCRTTRLAFVDPKLGQDRQDALDGAFVAAGVLQTPTSAEMAKWVEQVALISSRRKFRRAWWEDFYTDLAALFEHSPEALHGRRILLDGEGNLRAGGARKSRRLPTAVFFSPKNMLAEEADEQIDEDVPVPSSLRNRIAFMHPDIRWQQLDPVTRRNTRRRAHLFLESARLVARFRRGSVLMHLAAVLGQSKDKRVHGDALGFAFALLKGRRPQTPALEDMGFRLPTVAGTLISAKDGVFSAQWPGTAGGALQQLIQDAAPVSSALAGLEQRLLTDPNGWPFEGGSVSAWRDFLRETGVDDGLWPIPVSPATGFSASGDDITSPNLASRFLEGKVSSDYWIRATHARGGRANHPWTKYDLVGGVWWLPGQEEFVLLPEATRLLFAQLVVEGLDLWPDDVLVTRFRRPRAEREADPFEWPSPASAFLSEAEWLPVTRPGEPGLIDWRRPSAVWHYAENEKDPFPQFAPLLSSTFRRLLDQRPRAEDRLRSLGLRRWSDPADGARRVRWLGELFAEVPATLSGNFRKAYERSWELALVAGQPVLSDDVALTLVVSRRGQLEGMESSTDGPPVYVPDYEDNLTDLLYRTVDVPVLQVDPSDGTKVAEALRGVLGARLRLTSAARLLVLADDREVTVGEATGTLLVGEHPWLRDVLALTLELRASQFNRQTESTITRALGRLSRLRICVATKVRLRLEEHEESAPSYFRKAVPIQDDDFPTIVLEADGDAIGWDELVRLAPAIAEIVDPSIASPLELVLVELRARGNHERYTPLTEDLAVAFRESPQRIDEIRRTRRGTVTPLLTLVRPVVAHFTDGPGLAALADEESLDSPAAITAILAPFAERFPWPLERLIREAQDASDVGTLRRRLDIDFAGFNRTLASLGSPYAVITDLPGLSAALATYVQEHREAILGCLRLAFVRVFETEGSLELYLAAKRQVPNLPVPDAWLTEYESPPDSEIRAAADAWLAGQGAESFGTWTGQLPPLDDLREANRSVARQHGPRLQAIVQAWSERAGSAIPDWATSDSADAVAEILDAGGALDFAPLSLASLPTWLARLESWPEGMAPSPLPAEHGFTEQEIDAQSSREQREQALRKAERTGIRLDGDLMPAEGDGLVAIANRVREEAAETVRRSPTKEISLDSPPTGHRAGTREAGGGVPGQRRRITDPQRVAIGLVGEVVAYEWLRHHHGATPEAWKSKYREVVFGGVGDDSLGFDLALPIRGRIHFFEVKATPSERFEIELTETELAKAREFGRSHQYHILFVPNALDSGLRRVYQLPNPMAQDARAFYRWVGTGMRYQFRIQSED